MCTMFFHGVWCYRLITHCRHLLTWHAYVGVNYFCNVMGTKKYSPLVWTRFFFKGREKKISFWKYLCTCGRGLRQKHTHTDRPTFSHGENAPQQGYKPADTPSKGAYGRWESWSSSEVKRKPVGQIRFFSFLAELSISLQCCAVIPPDLGLSRRSVLEGSESLLIRPGGQRVYDDITQPLSLHTRPSVSLRVCLQILGSRGVWRWLHELKTMLT